MREVQASDFTPERLAYLFRHESEPRRDPGPLPAQVEAVLASIRRGLADAFAETSHPAEVTGDTLRQKLAMLLDPALLDPAMEALDPRRRGAGDRRASSTATWPGSSPTPRRGRTALSGRGARDPSAGPPRAAAAAAPDSVGRRPRETAAPRRRSPLRESAGRRNIHFVLEHLLPQLRTRQLRGAVVQTLSDTLGLTHPGHGAPARRRAAVARAAGRAAAAATSWRCWARA